MKKLIPLLLTLFMLLSAIPQPARADVAPPETVPGSNVNPGAESTQVQMVAETVTLIVSEDPADENGALARTEAVFTMRNLGAAEENMPVRFPLSFFNGNSDGFGGFPEIAGIEVKVNGSPVASRREIQPFMNSDSSFEERGEIPWSVFDVTFPPNEDVTIEVAYTVEGFGYFPYEVFKYVLETGAGWNGAIGSADIILRLPYEANKQNVWTEGVTGYGDPTSGGAMSGNEVRWHFENLEPTFESNLQFIVLAPSVWNDVLTETENVTRNPNDGEAWGRLGKAYKEIILMPRGYLRDDPAALETFEASKSAYETCLALLPNDSLWHYGYADLLWARYYWELYLSGKPDPESLLPTLLTHLRTALELDPNNQFAHDLLVEVFYSVPEAIAVKDLEQFEDTSKIPFENFDFLALTATPIPPTPYGGFPTETPQSAPEPVSTAQAFPAATTAPATESSEPAQPESSSNPICGSAAILPVLFGMVMISRRKNKR